MTKKQKAEFIISCPQIKEWVKLHMKSRIHSYGNVYNPTDLWETPIPESIKELPYGKEVFFWLTDKRHLYNSAGAIALMEAVLK